MHVQHGLLPVTGLRVEGATVGDVSTSVGFIVSGVNVGIIGRIVGGSTVGNIEGGRDERWKSS